MPSAFAPSIVAATLGASARDAIIEQPCSPASVVDPRAMSDARNPIFRANAEGIDKVAPFLAAGRARKPYRVLPGGMILKAGHAAPEHAPHLPQQVSLGHDSNVNTTSGRHL